MTKPELLVLCGTTPAMDAVLAPHFEVISLYQVADQTSWMRTHGANISHVLTDGHLGISADRIAALPSLQAISTYGVGYDAVDVSAALARGIGVSHTPGVLNDDVATSAVLLYLACYRNFIAETAQAQSGRWETEGTLPLSRSPDNRRVGILGLGRIGMEVARKLEAFGCQISYCTRTPRDVTYTYYATTKALAKEVEALICVTPGGAATRHLVNQDVIDALGPDGTLVNVGRGSVVDENALITALKDGKLARAGLDVFEDEPKIPEALRRLPNVVLTPHIGSATVETRAAMGDLAVRNLVEHLQTGNLISAIPECVAGHSS